MILRPWQYAVQAVICAAAAIGFLMRGDFLSASVLIFGCSVLTAMARGARR